jgi:hypothetical protein
MSGLPDQRRLFGPDRPAAGRHPRNLVLLFCRLQNFARSHGPPHMFHGGRSIREIYFHYAMSGHPGLAVTRYGPAP